MRYSGPGARQRLPARAVAPRRSTPWSPWISRASILLVLLVTLAVFWQVSRYEFVLWDDPINISENPYIQSMTWSNFLAFWQAPYGQLYIPLTYTLWALTAAVSRWGTAQLPGAVPLDPVLFHRLNLLVHLLSVLVVWRILRLLLGRTLPEAPSPATHRTLPQAEWAACGGALLFAVHPVQVEAVAWVTGLKDVLCGFLSYVAIWQYLRYANGSGEGTASGISARRQALHVLGPYGLATGAFILALLAKPTAVVVPVIAWVMDIWGWPQTWRTRRPAVLAWLILAGLWGLFTSQVQPATTFDFLSPLWARPLIAGDTVTFYLYKLGVPLWLGPDYGRAPEVMLAQRWVWLTGLAPWGIAGWLWYTRARRPWLVAATGVFVAGLLPMLGFVPFAFQGYSTVADRYLYLAMLGPAVALAWGLAQVRRRWLTVGCVVVLGIWGLRSASQTSYWQDTVSLFAHALIVHPGSSLAHNNLGMALATQNRLAEAVQHYTAALRFRPQNAEAQNNLGNALSRQGKIQEAIAQYTAALHLQPAFAEAQNNLGAALASQGRVAEAIEHYTTALRLQPAYARAYYNLGNALFSEGKTEEAIKHYMTALRFQPTLAEAQSNLGVALASQGRMAEAIEHYTTALQLQPRSVTAHYNLGVALANQGRLAEARQHFAAVLRLDPTHAAARRLLASEMRQGAH